MKQSPRARSAGLSLVEIVITVAILTIFLYGIIAIVVGLQGTFVQSQIVSDMQSRAQNALERIVALSSQAVTTDAQFTPIDPSTGIDSSGLQFRLIQSVASDGTVTYNDAQRVFIYGPTDNPQPNRGLIIGRGPDLATVRNVGAGSDTLLGTTDDNVNTLTGGVPYVELLLTNRYAPSSGRLFEVDVNNMVLTFTLRLNAVGQDGSFLLANDLVLTERVALRQ